MRYRRAMSWWGNTAKSLFWIGGRQFWSDEKLPDDVDGVITERSTSGDSTMMGLVTGTPSYMPPEQAAGRIDRLDERSDIYALGAWF